MATPAGKRGRPKKPRLDECHEVDERHISPPSTRSKRPVVKKYGGPNRSRDGFPLQCGTGMADVNTDEAIMGANGSIDMESVPSTQPAQSREPLPDVLKSGFRELSILEESRLHERIEHNVKSRKISSHDKVISIFKEVRQFRSDLEEIYNADITNLNHAKDAEIRQLKLECQSLQENLSVAQTSNEELDLRHKRFAQLVIKDSEARQEYVKKVFNEAAQATQNSGNGVKRRCKKLQPERGKQINSDHSLPVLNVKLQKSSGGNVNESSENLKPKQPNGDHNIQNAICGFYPDGAAKPTRLHMEMSETTAAVTTFQKMLLDCVITRSGVRLDHPDVFLVRPNHSSHYFKSFVYRIFFKWFENETFFPRFWESRFPVPNRSPEIFYDYYLREREKKSDTIEDPQFEEFCEMKVCPLLSKMFPAVDGDDVKVSFLEELGGPDLVSSFKSAAKTLWLLHKLAFSFEPPATVFKVNEGANFDPKHMKSTFVQLDDDDRLVPKVSFMIDPGLCLNGETIMKCEVYFARGPTTLPDLNKAVYHRRPSSKLSSRLEQNCQ